MRDAEIHLSLEKRGEPQRLVLGPDQQGDRRDHHEDETDREEHLVELGRTVEPSVEQALQHHAREGGGDDYQAQP